MIRRVRADALDPEQHPDLDLSRVQWVNRPGQYAYRFPVHSVGRDKHGNLVVALNDGGPLDVRYRCADDDEILLDLPLNEGEIERDQEEREITR